MGEALDYLGVGVGLRRAHYDDLWRVSHPIEWFELISENYMGYGGRPRDVAMRLKPDYPLVCHGLGLSLGSAEDVPEDYCRSLQELLQLTDAPWFSDHLCISSSLRHQYHDLLPVLKTRASLELVSKKIRWVQERFGRPFAIENISYYGESRHHELTELEFINRLLEATNCFLLLDINNVYVNQQNLGQDAREFLRQIPHHRVIQIHLAGHWDRGDFIIDTHGDVVCEEVWALYRWYLQQAGRPISTLIEWDNDLPCFEQLAGEARKAQKIVQEVFSETL